MSYPRDLDEIEEGLIQVLDDCRAFPDPITYRGFQGFFNVPQNVVAAQLEEVGWTEATARQSHSP